jgi:hypothetical protein
VLLSQVSLVVEDRPERLPIRRGLALARASDGQEIARERARLSRGQLDVGPGLDHERRGGEHGLRADRDRRLHLFVNGLGSRPEDLAESLDRERIGRARVPAQRPRRFGADWPGLSCERH